MGKVSVSGERPGVYLFVELVPNQPALIALGSGEGWLSTANIQTESISRFARELLDRIEETRRVEAVLLAEAKARDPRLHHHHKEQEHVS